MLLILEPRIASTYNSTCSSNFAFSLEEQWAAIGRFSRATEALIRTDTVAAPVAPTKKTVGFRFLIKLDTSDCFQPLHSDVAIVLSIFSERPGPMTTGSLKAPL
jgi:hypothetical protein